MKENYRPFSWEEYLKNPELLRTRDGREVKQLTRFEKTNWPIIGVIGKETKSWKHDGVYYSDSHENPYDLVLINPPTEMKKYHVIIKDPITGNVIDEKLVNSFCLFD